MVWLESLVTAFCAIDACDEPGLAACASILAEGSVKDRALAKVLADWCEAPARRQSMLDSYLAAYLTTREREIKNSFVAKKTARAACKA